MTSKAYLILEDGSVYEGTAFGAMGRASGEVVFNTSMTGYQEVLSDPSYAGQMVVMTYPLMGNYGINREDFESRQVQVSGFIVREASATPSHWQSTQTLHELLAERGVPGIEGLDTRALTRRLRLAGVMMGTITSDESPQEALERLRRLPSYGEQDYVARVSTTAPFAWEQGHPVMRARPSTGPRIAVLDMGLKYNILRILRGMGCSVTALPASATPEHILAASPDGVVLSPGPGDPALLGALTEATKALIGRVPILGICLGHQVLGRAFGGRTYKLKFGHRGANHPVRDLTTGRVHITSQNHGYAVDADSLPPEIEVTHLSLNDGTVEGMRHRELPILSIQYHAEASPGPRDNVYLFERWLELVRHNDV